MPRGAFGSPPEYRTADGWSADRGQAVPIVQRFWAENPMQPRFLAGQWVAVTKVDGYWGEELAVDGAAEVDLHVVRAEEVAELEAVRPAPRLVRRAEGHDAARHLLEHGHAVRARGDAGRSHGRPQSVWSLPVDR